MLAACRKWGAILLVLGGLWPLPAAGQVAGTVIPTDAEAFAIELSEGRLLRLDRPANSVFVANPEVADVSVRSANLVYLFGRATGETSLYAIGRDGNVIANLRVVVAHNVRRLKEALSQLIPDGKINVVSVMGGIVLSGSVGTPADAENARRLATRFIAENEEVINRLAVTQSNQVNLRVRFAEVSRTIVNQFGFNWSVVTDGAIDFALATANPVAGVNQALIRRQAGNFDLEVLFDALADDGLATILAEPNLTALSGETASFLAGGEFPIPVGRDDDTITIEFKRFGVSLAFTPTVLSESRISMRVQPEVSQLSAAAGLVLEGTQIPSLTTRRAETTVELASGQSFAIAGLLQDVARQDFSKYPGLGDIPVLGALFQSERFERDETELVIIVTPYIVKPVDTPDLPLPTDPYTVQSPEAPARHSETTELGALTIPLREGGGTAGTAPASGSAAGFIIE